VVVSTEKKSSFLRSPRDVFRRPSAAPEPIAPKFLHTTFPSKYFVLTEFYPPRLSFGGVIPPTPSFASLHYGLPYSIWQAIMMSVIGPVWSSPIVMKAVQYSICAISGACEDCLPSDGVNSFHMLMSQQLLLLTLTIQARCLTAFGHIALLHDNAYIKILTASTLEDWKRPPGRPRITWIKTVVDDLMSHNLTLTEAVNTAQNRPVWTLTEAVNTAQNRRVWTLTEAVNMAQNQPAWRLLAMSDTAQL